MSINKNHKDIMKQIDKIEKENFFEEDKEAKEFGILSAKEFWKQSK